MREQETIIAVLDDGKADLTREVEILSRKHKIRRHHNSAHPDARAHERSPDHPPGSGRSQSYYKAASNWDPNA